MTAMVFNFKPLRAAAFILWAQAATLSIAQAAPVVMASTTSTEQSGLFPYLLP